MMIPIFDMLIQSKKLYLMLTHLWSGWWHWPSRCHRRMSPDTCRYLRLGCVRTWSLDFHPPRHVAFCRSQQSLRCYGTTATSLRPTRHGWRDIAVSLSIPWLQTRPAAVSLWRCALSTNHHGVLHSINRQSSLGPYSDSDSELFIRHCLPSNSTEYIMYN